MLLHILSFLVSVVLGLFLWVLLLRLVLQYVGARYQHPVSQLLLHVSEWLIAPTKRYLRLRPIKGVDLAIVFWSLCVACLDVWATMAVATWSSPPLLFSFILGIVLVLQRLIQLLMAAIVIRAVMSWFGQPNAWFLELVEQVTEPILAPFRRWIPAVAGFDLSMLAVLVVLQVLLMLLRGIY